MSRTPQEKIEMLLDRLFEGRLLPFVGAGISMGARNPEHPEFRPTLDYMKKCLRREIIQYIRQNPGCSHSLLVGLLPKDMVQSRYERFAKKRHGVVNTRHKNTHNKIGMKKVALAGALQSESFDRLAEIAYWLFGADKLCVILQIRRFKSLEPLPAHRILAYLAREGLIGEIISTNYDCCIEKAYRNSFGSHFAGKNKPQPLAIHNLFGYRNFAGLRQDKNGLPTLRLYKINGCAQALTLDGDSESILLTERQLQSFRDRQWAHDLLADRARRHMLLFSGFGSEEPQVRHTALSVIEEFQAHDHKKQKTAETVASLPNAPFVAAYDQLSFTQAQIITAFHMAHTGKEDFEHSSAVPNALAASSLTGKAAADLGFRSGGKLSADNFFARLYQAAFGRLLKRYTNDRSDFYLWLKDKIPQPGVWRAQLLAWLYPSHTLNALTTSNVAEFEALFGSKRGLFHTSGSGLMAFWRWLFAAYHPDKDFLKGSDWYLPLQKDADFILGVLLILSNLELQPKPVPEIIKHRCSLLDELPEFKGSVIPATHLGLLVQFGTSPTLCLVRDSAPISNKLDANPLPGNLLLRVAIPSRQDISQTGRWQSSVKENGNIRLGRYYTVTPRKLIAAAQTPDRLASSIRKAFAAAPSPKPKAKLTRLTPGSKP